MRILLLVLSVFIGVSYVLPLTGGPMPTFNHEVIAFVGWLLVCCYSVWRFDAMRIPNLANLALLSAISLLPLLYIGAQILVGGAAYPLRLALTCGYLSVAFLVSVCAYWVTIETDECLHAWVFASIVIAAVLTASMALEQYLQLKLAPSFIASLVTEGRAYGNLRQPNHYSLFIALGILAALMLSELKWKTKAVDVGEIAAKRLPHWMWPLVCFLGASCSLSASRAGVVLLWTMTAVVVFGPGVSRQTKKLAIAAAISQAAGWMLLVKVAEVGFLPFYAIYRPVVQDVMSSTADISSSRFDIWRGSLSIISHQNFFGSGFGGLPHEYLMADLPKRAALNLNNAHNLILNFAIEFGLAFTALWTVLVFGLLLKIRNSMKDPTGQLAIAGLAAVGSYSMLEYPLWYAYFLFPTAYLAGLATARAKEKKEQSFRLENQVRRFTPLLGLLAFVLIAAVRLDYDKIVMMFDPKDISESERLRVGYQSRVFEYFADYGVITNIPITPQTADAHRKLATKVSQIIVEGRVIFALATSSAASGRLDESALYLSKVREFAPKDFLSTLQRLSQSDINMLAPALLKLNEMEKPAQTDRK